MEFGICPLEEAVGAILAHGVRAGGKLFKKGRLLSESDVSTLQSDGLASVTVVRLEPGDVLEDEAARRIATKCAAGAVRVGAAFTGRANLYATEAGVVAIDAAVIDQINAIDESITVATLHPYDRVAARQMLATIKIIPFAAPDWAVQEAEKILRDGPPIRVAPFRPMNAALISTSLPGMKTSLLDKNAEVVGARLRSLGSHIVFEDRVPHGTDALAGAIGKAESQGCDPILVFGASAITDRRDVIPAAIEQAGGRITHFGMPVDPGNLLLMGELRGTKVVGLPGCARSPKLNGFDFVLQRLAAGLPVTRTDLAEMGVGGLLTEIPTRPQPRDERPSAVPHAPKVAAVILAAGLSSRMGNNKLLAPLGGKPLVRHVVEAAEASAADLTIVVTGNRKDDLEAALTGPNITLTHNPDFSNGLSSSLKQGLSVLPEDVDAAIILLGDMPLIDPRLIDTLIAAFDPAEERAICVPTRHGKRGNPVLWARRFFPEMQALSGDVGAKHLMGAYPELVCEVEADDDAPLSDVDTPEALEALASRS